MHSQLQVNCSELCVSVCVARSVPGRLHPGQPGAEGPGRGLRYCQPGSCSPPACTLQTDTVTWQPLYNIK